MKTFSVLLATTALIAFPYTGKAETYVGLGGGLSVGHEKDISTNIDQSAQYDLGWGALGTVGYKFDGGLRTELELGYRTNGLDDLQASPVTGGDLNLYTVMANVLYDFNHNGAFKPYVGVGAGMAWADFNNIRTISGSSIDETNTGPAVQGLVGASYAISNRLDLFTQYQYLYAFEIDPHTASGLNTSADLHNSLITAGVRYSFGSPELPAPLVPVAAPAPAPVEQPVAAPAAPAAPQKYMVFFDWNRSDITIEAADILKTVADNVKKGEQVQLDLTGHADRSGPDGYNQKLSERRAEAVKKHLVRLGVQMGEITTHAKGESDPLVTTDDGVREPQNRRVEIVTGR